MSIADQFGTSKATTVALKLEHTKRYEAAKIKSEEQWIEISTDLHNAYELVCCALIGIHHKAILKLDLKNEDFIEFASLFASYLRGIDLTLFSIKSARYSQAHNLIKNEIESVAAIREIEDKTRNSGKNPNVRKLTEPVKKMYGYMNNVAHPGNVKWSLSALTTLSNKGQKQISSYPIFNKNMASSLFQLHCGLCIEFSEYALKFASDNGYSEPLKDEKDFISKATEIFNKAIS